MYILSQIIGFFALLFSCLSLWQKSRDKLLNYQIVEPVLSTISDFLLHAYSGAICCFIALFRNVSCRFKLNERFVFSITIIFSLLYSVFFVRSFIDILPVIALIIYSFSIIFSKSLYSIRVAVIVNSSLWLIYELLFFNFISSIRNLIIIGNAVMSIIKRKNE